ncbi:Hypothetical predicted protein [Paramuricea clavata]|uniref:Uncharacterized protein n=1 Tax=Paramuricea clavata TaxID=317549 RepID=A0A6S7K6Y2_PARCT|nr:Hypothetical predicted protein [Paramuricea clavata]
MSEIDLNIEDDSLCQTCSSNINQGSCTLFHEWLKSMSLGNKHSLFLIRGITQISLIEDVSHEDAGDLALTDIQFRRLLRVYTNYKAEQAKCLEKEKAKPNPPQSTYRTSSALMIVSLPKGMKNFFHTRDGQVLFEVQHPWFTKQSSQRYPEVAVLLQQESEPKKALCDPLCKAMESCQNALGLAQEKMALCRKEIDSTLKCIGGGEEVIIEGLFKISTGVKVYCHHPARGLGSKEKLEGTSSY